MRRIAVTKVRECDRQGRVQGGLKIYITNNNTSYLDSANAVDTYSDADGATPNTWPVETNSYGLASIYIDDTAFPVQYTLTEADGTLVYTDPDVLGIVDPEVNTYSVSEIQLPDGSGLKDSNGNEVLTVQAGSASAVNYINLQNSATGNDVILESLGSDSNVDMTIKTKGSATLTLQSGLVTCSNNFTVPLSGQFRASGLLYPSNAEGLNGQVLIKSSDGVMGFRTINLDASAPANYKTGLEVNSATGDPDNDITVNAGTIRSSGNISTIVLNTAMTKRLDAVWSAGTANGGRATAVSLTAGTWYHVYLIADTAGNVDVILDTSLTCVNGLSASGYTLYAYLDSIYYTAGSVIHRRYQYGKHVIYHTPLTIFEPTGATAGELFTIETPIGKKVKANLQYTTYSDYSINLNYVGHFQCPDLPVLVPSLSTIPLASMYVYLTVSSGIGQLPSGTTEVLTDTSSRVRFVANTGGAVTDTMSFVCTGYEQL